MEIAALATEAILAPAIGAGLGFLADEKFGWFPWGMLVGLTAGAVGAASIVTEITRRSEDIDDESKSN